MQLFFLFVSILGVSGCAERLPEEKFMLLPSNDFPKLGYVPDRPALPKVSQTRALKEQLMVEKTTSEQRQQEKQGHVLQINSQ